MSEHGPCLHEGTLAAMAKDIEYIRKGMDGINGLPTKVALNEQSISRLWWMVGGVGLLGIGLLAKILAPYFL